MNKEKAIMLFEKAAFYISNIIILGFIINAFAEQSLEKLLTLSLSLLGLIGGLSALCYSSSTSQKDVQHSKIFRLSGDRFLHSFMTLVMALLFSGAIITIKKYGFLNINNSIISNVVNIFLSIFATIFLIKAGRSFTMGFHMSLRILNQRYKLKDEKLYDDLKNN